MCHKKKVLLFSLALILLLAGGFFCYLYFMGQAAGEPEGTLVKAFFESAGRYRI